MNRSASLHTQLLSLGLSLTAVVTLMLTGCATPPPPPPPAPVVLPPKPPAPIVVVPPPPAPPAYVSNARTERDYRRDAASHLYETNFDRIYKGKLPPLLYAVGVLQVEIDSRGRVTATSWMRAPKHAPEVMAEIERMVRSAEPYPAPVRLGRVTYTDTWLWAKNGKFQLDTLTEGQL